MWAKRARTIKRNRLQSCNLHTQTRVDGFCSLSHSAMPKVQTHTNAICLSVFQSFTHVSHMRAQKYRGTNQIELLHVWLRFRCASRLLHSEDRAELCMSLFDDTKPRAIFIHFVDYRAHPSCARCVWKGGRMPIGLPTVRQSIKIAHRFYTHLARIIKFLA